MLLFYSPSPQLVLVTIIVITAIIILPFPFPLSLPLSPSLPLAFLVHFHSLNGIAAKCLVSYAFDFVVFPHNHPVPTTT